MGQQQFYVEGSYLGSRLIPNNRIIPGLEIRPHHSYAMFCMRCGELWGRLFHDKAQLTQVVNRPCKKHGDGRLSFVHYFQGEPYNFEDDWPKAAIRSEFLAELAIAERELSGTT